MKFLGIDFGTVWTKAAIYDTKTKEVIRVKMDEESDGAEGYELYGGDYACPTAVYDGEEGYVVGKKATNSRNIEPAAFHARFKPQLSRENAHENKELLRWVRKVIEYVYERALSQAGVKKFTKVILTVPSSTLRGDSRWKSMESVANDLGFKENLIFVKEPVAAAYYVLSELLSQNQLKEGENILVYDYGGGTFDPALVKVISGTIRCDSDWDVSQGSDNGGIYIDEDIIDDMKHTMSFIEEDTMFIEEFPIDNHGRPVDNRNVRAYYKALKRLDGTRNAAVVIKHTLSDSSLAKVSINYTHEYNLTREHFNELIKGRIDDTIQCCEALIGSEGWQQLSRVVLVGGSSMIPLVATSLNEKGQFEIMGANKIDVLNAVAMGAAIYPALQPTVKQRRKFGLKAIERGDYAEAELQFKLIEDYFWLGMMAYSGIGQPVRYKKAYELFCKADNSECNYMRGILLFYGLGVRKNDEEAKRYLSKTEVSQAETFIKVIDYTASREEYKLVYDPQWSHPLHNGSK